MTVFVPSGTFLPTPIKLEQNSVTCGGELGKNVTVKFPSPKVDARFVSDRRPEILRFEDATGTCRCAGANNAPQKHRTPFGLKRETRSLVVRDLINGEITQNAYSRGCSAILPTWTRTEIHVQLRQVQGFSRYSSWLLL